MKRLQPALDYLEREPLLHIDMLEAIRRKQANILTASENGVLVYHTYSEVYMMSAKDPDTAQSMISEIHDAILFVAHQPFMIPLAEQALGLSRSLVCVQAAYLHKEPVPMEYEGVQIEKLDKSHLKFVQDWYSHELDESYLMERLGSGIMYGAYVQGELAGFIGEHAEGSIGMLEILPKFRRRGIGEKLEAFKTNVHLDAGYVPFGQIVAGNMPSLELQKKLGYTISEDTIAWLQ